MDYAEYSFGNGNKLPLDDINIPQEVRDYIINLCEVNEVIYEIYPPDLIERGMIISTWNEFDLNSDNIEFQSFNLFEKVQFSVFSQGATFYDKVDDNSPGYMVYRYLADNSVVLIKV